MAEEDMGYEEEDMEAEKTAEEEQYEERRTKEKALEKFTELKNTTVDITNYQKIFQEATATLDSLRLLVGVEDSRLSKVSEDVQFAFQSIQKQNIRRGTGGVYEDSAYLLRQAMDFFEDRKDLSELERAYLKVLVKKLYDAYAAMDGIAITNKAIEVMKEILSERMNHQDINIKEWVQNKLEAFSTKITALEDMDSLKEKIAEKDAKIKELTEEIQKLLGAKAEKPIAPAKPKENIDSKKYEKYMSLELSTPEQVIEIVGKEAYDEYYKIIESAVSSGQSAAMRKGTVSLKMQRDKKVPHELATKIATFMAESFERRD